MEEQKKGRGKKIGTVEDARRILWKALERAGELAEREEQEPGDVLRVLHAISQAVTAYARVSDVSELEQRLKHLEQIEQERGEALREGGPRISRRTV